MPSRNTLEFYWNKNLWFSYEFHIYWHFPNIFLLILILNDIRGGKIQYKKNKLTRYKKRKGLKVTWVINLVIIHYINHNYKEGVHKNLKLIWRLFLSFLFSFLTAHLPVSLSIFQLFRQWNWAFKVVL